MSLIIVALWVNWLGSVFAGPARSVYYVSVSLDLRVTWIEWIFSCSCFMNRLKQQEAALCSVIYRFGDNFRTPLVDSLL